MLVKRVISGMNSSAPSSVAFWSIAMRASRCTRHPAMNFLSTSKFQKGSA
jgi:hypothetical protein